MQGGKSTPQSTVPWVIKKCSAILKTQQYISVQKNPDLTPSQINPMHRVKPYLTPF